MALIKDVFVPTADATASYHRIDQFTTLRSPNMARTKSVTLIAAKGGILATVASYASKEAMEAGATPLSQKSYSFRFGLTQPENVEGGFILSDQPTLTDIYQAIKETPDFADAADE